MGHRYVFWRTSTGRPAKADDHSYAPHHLLAEYGRASQLSPEERISWNVGNILGFDTAITASVVIVGPDDIELNEADTGRIVHRAITRTIKRKGVGKPIQPEAFIQEADILAREHYRQTQHKYVLVTSLSVASMPAQRIRSHPCEIRPLNKREGYYKYPDSLRSQRRLTAIDRHVDETSYLPVRVTTRGRTFQEATDEALKALTVLRGLWNLFATLGRWSWSAGFTAKNPLGVIHAGPIHTLHYPNGTPVEDVFWYDPDFVREHTLFEPRPGWERVEANRRWAMSRIACLPYRREMERLLHRYSVALDQPNLHTAFLHLWAILETITSTVGKRYDETIRRTAWGRQESDLKKDMLNALRLHRNRLVHQAEAAEEPDQIALLCKRFVDPHLLHLIRNDFRVSTLEEYGRCLALPNSEDKLRSHIRTSRRVAWVLGKLKRSR